MLESFAKVHYYSTEVTSIMAKLQMIKAHCCSSFIFIIKNISRPSRSLIYSNCTLYITTGILVLPQLWQL